MNYEFNFRPNVETRFECRGNSKKINGEFNTLSRCESMLRFGEITALAGGPLLWHTMNAVPSVPEKK